MSKGIIVVDMPECCEECEFQAFKESDETEFCYLNQNRYLGDTPTDARPEWCPINPMPEKREFTYNDLSVDMQNTGWNACMDALGGSSASE